MSLLEGYKIEEAEAKAAAEVMGSRIVELEAQLDSVYKEIEELRAQPPVVVKSDLVSVDFNPVLSVIADLKNQLANIPAPVVSGGRSDQANWDKLWSVLSTLVTQTNKFSKFVDAVSSRFGI